MTDRVTGHHRTDTKLGGKAKWTNVAGAVIPAHGVVQFKANFAATYSQASKPDGDDGLFFVNGFVDVANAAKGESLLWDRPRLVLLDGSPTVGTEVGPVAGSWAMAEGGTGFRVMHQAVGGVGAVAQVGGGSGSQRIWFTIVSVECVSETEVILTVLPTHYTGGCTAAIPGEDHYGYVIVEDVCSILLFYTAAWLVGKTGAATYMYPRSGTCVPLWLVDTICGTPECA